SPPRASSRRPQGDGRLRQIRIDNFLKRQPDTGGGLGVSSGSSRSRCSITDMRGVVVVEDLYRYEGGTESSGATGLCSLPAAEAAAGWVTDGQFAEPAHWLQNLTLCDRRPGQRVRQDPPVLLSAPAQPPVSARRLVLRNNSSSSAADPESCAIKARQAQGSLAASSQGVGLKAVETLISRCRPALSSGSVPSRVSLQFGFIRLGQATARSRQILRNCSAPTLMRFPIGYRRCQAALKLYTPFLASDLLLPRLWAWRILWLNSRASELSGAADHLRLTRLLLIAECSTLYLEGRASLYRQTVCLSGVRFPELSGLFGGHMRNWRGKLALRPYYAGLYGEAGLLGGPLASVGAGPLAVRFVQFASSGPAEASTARLAAFRRRLLPWLREGQRLIRVLVYAPSYLDWADLRAELRKESLDFCAISEYTPANKAASYQGLFREGQVRILLYSERYHFYHRQRLRGIHNLLFYGPPTHPAFFEELCRLALADAAPAAPACAILVDSATDWHSVAPLCGPRRAGELARAGPV
uniref:PCIF1_WW domain-containing protein n=1 Tax=Macrostomum lignano TaxID=282301 RepID=A0A1I8JCQ3_9PLAT